MKSFTAKTPAYKSQLAQRVDGEIAMMKAFVDRASSSREAALAFLQKAGIVDAKGNLAKQYR